jgi:hypothetical protein
MGTLGRVTGSEDEAEGLSAGRHPRRDGSAQYTRASLTAPCPYQVVGFHPYVHR